MSETTDDFLQHYGVVGMKWGKRSGGSGGSGGSSGGNKAVAKANLKVARKDVFKGAGASVKAHKGRTIASALLLGPSATVGIQLARSAGHSKGASIAIGLLAGAPGGLIAAELSARKSAKSNS